MKKTHNILFFLLFAFVMNAQHDRKIPCYTYEAMEEIFSKDPEARKRYEAAEAQRLRDFQTMQNENAQKTTAPPVYTVPVVFHVLHTGGSENVSDAVCIAALDQVNKDYARTSSDTNLITPFFKPYYVNSEIVFMLAHKDPNGNCTSGIVHHYDINTDWAQTNHYSNCAYTWDPTKYLNIYIVKQIIPTGTVTGGGIIVGYTFKPGTWWPTGSQADAIVYNYQFLSGGNPPNARSLSHEIGHWLGLSHTWGNTNNPGVSCGDDGVQDTPVTKGEFGSCPSSTIATCTQTYAPMNGKNNVENIMNYSDCPRMFTQGQTNIMRNTLQSSVSGRNNLVTASNHTFTGINSSSVCAPISDFLSTTNTYTVCSGQSLTFKDISYNGTVATWQWAATNGGTVANQGASVTAITFPNPGTSIVTLTVSNAQGSSTSSKTVIVVNGVANVTYTMSESFETGNLPANWSIQNLNAGSVTWQITASAASHGVFSAFLDGTSSPANHIDILNMPSINFLANGGAPLTFKYAYARASSSNNDKFRVQLSADCGGTWQDVFTLSAASMASGSGGVTSTPFVPNSNQWKFYDCSSHPNFFNFMNSPCVYARFWFKEDENGSGFGNRLYIDEVNFNYVTGINDFTKEIALRIYPNPAQETVSVLMNLGEPQNIGIKVFDISGKEVMPDVEKNVSGGEQEIHLNVKNLSTGIYFAHISYKGVKLVRKFVKE